MVPTYPNPPSACPGIRRLRDWTQKPSSEIQFLEPRRTNDVVAIGYYKKNLLSSKSFCTFFFENKQSTRTPKSYKTDGNYLIR